ncbi:MAG: calcium/sodium antiporter [Pseudomonadota bacterium]
MLEISSPLLACVAVAGGLVLLIYAGDLLVHGSVGLATRFHVPHLLIGLTIVAFGTSAPELFISAQAVLSDRPGIAIGNVVGSNIANVFLVLGIPSIIAATRCKQDGLRRNTWIMIAVTFVFIWFCETGPLQARHGYVLLGLLALFLAYSGYRAMRTPANSDLLGEVAEMSQHDGGTGMPKTVGMILLGLIGLPIGATLVVDGGTVIAASIGVSEAVIGLSLVAIGTSLPELATTIAAAMRRTAGVALGNAIGSNIFNILAVMGVATLFAPASGIPIPDAVARFDVWVMLLAALVILAYTQFQWTIGRTSGIVFLLIYVAYMFVLFFTGRADMGFSSGESLPSTF